MYTVSSRVRNASTFTHIVHPHCELILILSQAETSKTVATQPKLRYFPAGTSCALCVLLQQMLCPRRVKSAPIWSSAK